MTTSDERPGRRRRPEPGDRSSNRLRPQELQRQRLDAALEDIAPAPSDAPAGYREVRLLLAAMRAATPAVRKRLIGQLFDLLAGWKGDDFERAADIIRGEEEAE